MSGLSFSISDCRQNNSHRFVLTDFDSQKDIRKQNKTKKNLSGLIIGSGCRFCVNVLC